ncbi:hypothetical protein D9M71_551790 [compost metagenome]
MAAGGVDLAPGQAPALGGTPGEGSGQAATGGGAQLWLDAKSIDQCAIGHCVVGNLQAQVLGPAVFVLQAEVLQVLHYQDQRGGRAALADGDDYLACAGEVGTAAAQGTGHGEA